MDDIPEPPVTPVSIAGDLWYLGSHRLICGDSTSADVVGRLLGNIRPLLMVTDPPYGVEYDPSWRNQAGAAKTKRTGKVLNDDRADWREVWALFPGDVAYVWHGALHSSTVAESLVAAGFAVRSQIIWAKDRLGLTEVPVIVMGHLTDAQRRAYLEALTSDGQRDVCPSVVICPMGIFW